VVAELDDAGPRVLLVEDDVVVIIDVDEVADELVVDEALEMVTDIVAALKLYKFITQLLPHISEGFPRHGKLHWLSSVDALPPSRMSPQ
jgi:DNA helicase HerA-like ATPase